MKGNQNLPKNRSHQTIWPVNHYHFLMVLEATVENITINPDTEAPINHHTQIQIIFPVIVILNHRVDTVHHRPFEYHGRPSNYQKKPTYVTRNTYSNNSWLQSPHYDRDGNRSRRPFSRNCLCNVTNYINLLLGKEQTDDTMSNTKNAETRNRFNYKY